MPPVGYERFAQPSPEESAMDREVRQKAQAAHNLMKGIALESPKTGWSVWKKIFSLDMPKRSAVATYEVEGQPEHIKMQAWLGERRLDNDEVVLTTRLISDISGEPKAISSECVEAYTDRGELRGWAFGAVANDKMQRIQDIHETLDLIVEASRDDAKRHGDSTAFGGVNIM